MTRVFISYSRESSSHAKDVARFGSRLRDRGIDVHLVRSNATPRDGWSAWLKSQIAMADAVLIVGSGPYKRLLDQRVDERIESHRKGEPATGPHLKGDWSDTITDDVFYPSGGLISNKLIPILLSDESQAVLPRNLESLSVYRIPVDEEVLYRRLTGQVNSFRRIDVDTVDDFLDVVSPTSEHWRIGRWFFRGVAVASWNLTPSLFRISWDMFSPTSRFHGTYLDWLFRHHPTLRGLTVPKDDSLTLRAEAHAYRAVEWRMLCNFLHSANLHGFPVPDFDYWWTTAKNDADVERGLLEFGRWPLDRITPQLAFAQHHGVPTRLLDWSFSPLSASWFAVSDAVESLYRHHIGERAVTYSKPDDGRFSVWAINAESDLTSPEMVTLEILAPSYHLNPRINAQKGVFTLLRADDRCISYGAERLDHDKFVQQKVTANHPVLLQITAPHRIAPALLQALDRHGVSRSTIYPTVDNVHAADTDMFRAETLKSMLWLQDPSKNYVPAGAQHIAFYVQEREVSECCMPDEGVREAVMRLFREGLKAAKDRKTVPPTGNANASGRPAKASTTPPIRAVKEPAKAPAAKAPAKAPAAANSAKAPVKSPAVKAAAAKAESAKAPAKASAAKARS